jgi:cellulose synthase/poly-beta-1,6-N-acetylglucosamine synthase-like glycosyltransferase
MEEKPPYYLFVGKAADLKETKERLLFRFFEILPGALAWGTLFGAVVFSWLWPYGVAVFIILFDVYWLLKTVFLSIHLLASYRKLRRNLTVDWLSKMDEAAFPNQNFPGAANWRDFYHLVILPFYNESADIIRSSLTSLRDSRYPGDRLIVVLAAEERAGEHGASVAKKMKEEFGGSFFKFIVVVHPGNIIGEIAGKGSNEAFAAREARRLIEAEGIILERVMLSVLDSDTKVYPEYFGCLTWNYLTCEKPFRSSYQPVPVFNNNIWEAPFFSRVVASSATLWHMMQQESVERMTTFSSHSMSFKAIIEMGYWQTNIVSEDSRVFWQALLRFDGDYRVIPMHYPVSMDACLAASWAETARNQYKQQRRWGWGSENIPYLFFGFYKNKKIAFRVKIYHALVKLEGYWSWATNAIMIFMLGWLPLVLGGEQFNGTVMSYKLPIVARTLMTLALVGMFASSAVSFLLLPLRPKKYGRFASALMILQWLFLPVSVMILGSFPGLDAQTRLMLGKYMGFWVTNKERKESEGQPLAFRA